YVGGRKSDGRIRGVKPTPKGYIRRYYARYGKARMEHVVIWEEHHGREVPEGYQIHHVNGVKHDNRIENLRLVDTLIHKRIHSGCYQDDNGEWFKPCRKCGKYKPVKTEYYERKDGISPWCRECCIRNAVENKRKRKARKRS